MRDRASPAVSIGTAQFGMDYGIANLDGRVSPEVARAILQRGSARGCEWLDTAAAYGVAESVLLATGESEAFRICTKVGSGGMSSPEAFEAELSGSLHRLGRTRVDILLLHRSQVLRGPAADDVMSWARSEKRAGRIGSFGVSVYAPEELNWERLDGIDWVQFPLSVLAQHWVTSGNAVRLRSMGVRVQARSILAQGLVATPVDRIPEPLRGATGAIESLHLEARLHNTTPVHIALSFAVQSPVDMIVLGFDSVRQLDECMDAIEDPLDLGWGAFACPDEKLLDPRAWSSGMRILP